MRRHLAPLLLALVFPALLWAAPPTVTIEAEVKPSGQYVTVTPKGDAVSVVYVGLSGVDPLPSAILKDPRMFVLDTRGMPAGRYKFAAVGSSKEGEQARVDFVVVVGDAPPGPGPGPGPGPEPPPADPLTKAYQAAYDKETDAQKAGLKKSLATIYTQAAEEAKDPAVKTWGDLSKRIGDVMGNLGLRGKLPEVQKVTQGHLQQTFPSDATRVMTTDDRQLATNTFKRLAAALEGVK